MVDPNLMLTPTPLQGHAIVVGHGRVGGIVCMMLDRHRFPYVAVDKDPHAIADHRKAGRQVYYSDATDLSFLKSCGLLHASAVVVTIHTKSAIDDIVKLVRRVRPDIAIISRARDAEHASRLYAIDVTDAVPETVEASLQLSEATLVSLGLPAGPVIASIHQIRDEFRQELQAGRTPYDPFNPLRELAQIVSLRARRPAPRGGAPT